MSYRVHTHRPHRLMSQQQEQIKLIFEYYSPHYLLLQFNGAGLFYPFVKYRIIEFNGAWWNYFETLCSEHTMQHLFNSLIVYVIVINP